MPSTTAPPNVPPRWALVGLAALMVTVVLSGCLSDAGGETVTLGDDTDDAGTNNTTGPSPSPTATPTPTPTPSNDNDPDNDTTPSNNTTDPGGNNTTGGNGTVRDWGDPAAAKVRPGVQTVFSGGQCTANFVYHSPSRDTYYLGSAAHCVDSGQIGELVRVRGTDGNTVFEAPIVYNSWWAMGISEPGEDVPDGEGHIHDFALFEIPAEHLDKVHPSVLHWGGPTDLADPGSQVLGQGVMAYGHSGLRNGLPDQGNHQQGVFWSQYTRNDHNIPAPVVTAYLATPTVFGDSGSGLMTADGKALGVASQIVAGLNPGAMVAGAWFEYAPVAHALDYLNNEQGWDLELVTADLINAPTV